MSNRQQQWPGKTVFRRAINCVLALVWDGLWNGALDMRVVCKTVERGREITIVLDKKVFSFFASEQAMDREYSNMTPRQQAAHHLSHPGAAREGASDALAPQAPNERLWLRNREGRPVEM